MQLETPRLWLYPLTPEQLLQAQRDFPGVAAQMEIQAHPRPFRERLQKRRIYKAKSSWLESTPNAWLITTTWLIVRKSDRTLVGEAGFKGPGLGQHTLEIGYNTQKNHRGQGIMTEAVDALCRFAFSQTQYPIRTILALTRRDNIASHKVLEKNGFVRVPCRSRYWSWERKNNP